MAKITVQKLADMPGPQRRRRLDGAPRQAGRLGGYPPPGAGSCPAAGLCPPRRTARSPKKCLFNRPGLLPGAAGAPGQRQDSGRRNLFLRDAGGAGAAGRRPPCLLHRPAGSVGGGGPRADPPDQRKRLGRPDPGGAAGRPGFRRDPLASAPPAVVFDRETTGLPVSSVSMDNAGIIREAVRKLWKLGYRRFAFLQQDTADLPNHRLRLEGYRQAAAEAVGADFIELPLPDPADTPGRAAFAEAVKGRVCFSAQDGAALAAYRLLGEAAKETVLAGLTTSPSSGRSRLPPSPSATRLTPSAAGQWSWPARPRLNPTCRRSIWRSPPRCSVTTSTRNPRPSRWKPAFDQKFPIYLLYVQIFVLSTVRSRTARKIIFVLLFLKRTERPINFQRPASHGRSYAGGTGISRLRHAIASDS